MKPDLSYEQCKDLKKWGLDQTLREGDWIWWGEKTTRLIESYVMSQEYMNMAPGAWVKLPFAEQMIEFLGWHFGELVRRGDCWEVFGFRGKGLAHEALGENIQQVLYALCKKVFGGKETE